MRAYNLRSDRYIATDVIVAETIFARMKGLLGRDNLFDGKALLLKPCNWVHTVGMRFSIDIIFLSRERMVLAVNESVPPNRFSAFVPRARCAIELPAGTAMRTETRVGDIIEFI